MSLVVFLKSKAFTRCRASVREIGLPASRARCCNTAALAWPSATFTASFAAILLMGAGPVFLVPDGIFCFKCRSGGTLCKLGLQMIYLLFGLRGLWRFNFGSRAA